MNILKRPSANQKLYKLWNAVTGGGSACTQVTKAGKSEKALLSALFPLLVKTSQSGSVRLSQTDMGRNSTMNSGAKLCEKWRERRTFLRKLNVADFTLEHTVVELVPRDNAHLFSLEFGLIRVNSRQKINPKNRGKEDWD